MPVYLVLVFLVVHCLGFDSVRFILQYIWSIGYSRRTKMLKYCQQQTSEKLDKSVLWWIKIIIIDIFRLCSGLWKYFLGAFFISSSYQTITAGNCVLIQKLVVMIHWLCFYTSTSGPQYVVYCHPLTGWRLYWPCVLIWWWDAVLMR